MKYKKQSTLGVAMTLLITLLLAGCAAGLGPLNNDETISEITEIIERADSGIGNMAVVPIETIKRENLTVSDGDFILPQDVKEEILRDYEARLSSVFGRYLTNSYLESSDTYLQDFVRPDGVLQLDVDAGVAGSTLKNIEFPDEKTAVAEMSIVGWLTSILQDSQTGEYYIWMSFNRDSGTWELTLDNDTWKVISSTIDHKEFAPINYEYEKGRFDTFEAAVEAAALIDPLEENPF